MLQRETELAYALLLEGPSAVPGSILGEGGDGLPLSWNAVKDLRPLNLLIQTNKQTKPFTTGVLASPNPPVWSLLSGQPN